MPDETNCQTSEGQAHKSQNTFMACTCIAFSHSRCCCCCCYCYCCSVSTFAICFCFSYLFMSFAKCTNKVFSSYACFLLRSFIFGHILMAIKCALIMQYLTYEQYELDMAINTHQSYAAYPEY